MRDWILKIMAGFVFIIGLGELALSQVHILTSTKVFASEIGIYLFIFIIFGLVTAFNTFSLKTWRGIIFYIATSWIAVAGGFIYLKILQTDVKAQKNLTMADVNDSWLLVVISICIYLLGSILIPLLNIKNAKTTNIL